MAGELIDGEVQGWAATLHEPEPGAPARDSDLLFIHGMAVGGWMWSDAFLAPLRAAGFRCWTVSLPGRHGGATHATGPQAIERALAALEAGASRQEALTLLARALPGASVFDGPTLGDFADAVAGARAGIDAPVRLVGYSLGGAVAQALMRRGADVAGVALVCSAPPYGLWRAGLEMAVTAPDLWVELARFALGGARAVDLGVIRRHLFPTGVPEAVFRGLAARVTDESLAALGQAAGFPPFAPPPGPRRDVLVVGGAQDRFVPPLDVLATAAWYGTAPRFIAGSGHAPMVDAGAPELAALLRDWAAGQGDRPAPAGRPGRQTSPSSPASAI